MARRNATLPRPCVNLREMMTLKVPVIAVVIGEGGSGARWASAWPTVSSS
ncbi:MAG: hypothetical protein CM1200mP29_13940 [Verrucomicrobiota bacterium]|nr:MAG: hypothetical protein CM1200mP29_13940 [Verrucomicrobiota bacterium]